MQKKAFIFIGRSGCGKGTQADLLIKDLKKIDPDKDFFHLESGERFREFVKGDSYTARLAKKVNDEGGLQPAFLSIYVWSDLLVENIKENEHLILDGVPRREEEAIALKKALVYYGYEEVHVIYLDVSKEWAMKRLVERGRGDDDRVDIKNKMSWFDQSVVLTINFLKEKGSIFIYHKINGEQSIEGVHKEIKEKVFKKTNS